MDDLVRREGLWYKKFSDVPFTGEVEGLQQGNLKNGKQEGLWILYWSNGQLLGKGVFRNGKREGPFVRYDSDGNLDTEFSGVYKNDRKISD